MCVCVCVSPWLGAGSKIEQFTDIITLCVCVCVLDLEPAGRYIKLFTVY